MSAEHSARFVHGTKVLKIGLLAAVITGHVSALWLPKFAEIHVSDSNALLELILKIASSLGREAALAFVFLSGYLTAHHFDYRRSFGSSARVVRERLNRLYPEYLFALGATAVLDAAGRLLFPEFYYHQRAFLYDPERANDVGTFFTNLLYMQPTFDVSFGSNGPLWTIGYLVQFYVAFAFTGLVSSKKLVRLVCSMAFVGIAFGFGYQEWAVFFMVWLAGTGIRAREIKIVQCRIYWTIMFSILVLVSSKLISLTLAAVTVTFGCALIVSAMAALPNDPRVRNSRTINVVSDVSFSIYMLHMPILFLASGMATASNVGSSGGVYFIAVLLCVLFTSFLASHSFLQARRMVRPMKV